MRFFAGILIAVTLASVSSVEAALPPCPTPTATGCRQVPSSVQNGAGGVAGLLRRCGKNGAVTFTSSPFEFSKIELIEPMGQMVGGHVTPIDHGYVFGVHGRNSAPDEYAVLSPAKGWVTGLSKTVRFEQPGQPAFVDYALTIEFSCTHSIRYSNMSSFAKKLLARSGPIGDNEGKSMWIPVQAGEEVGRTGKFGIDVYVRDRQKPLTGFVVPSHYETESDKIYSADLFQYYREPLRSELLAKDVRQAAPRFGKIDQDVDGRLVGNWFREGTNGYGGPPETLHKEGYWKGHLSFVYDAVDPRGVTISIGDWQGDARQFGVAGNGPDPKTVSVATGLVTYELLQPDWTDPATGKRWDHEHYVKAAIFTPIADHVEGTVLAQLTSKRNVKVEFFPGKTAAEVHGFTNAAVIYER